MPLFKVKKTGEIGYFSDKLRPSYDLYHQKAYYFLKIVDPSTDWSTAYAPHQYKFTGKTGRYETSELTPTSTRELKSNQKTEKSTNENFKLNESSNIKKIWFTPSGKVVDVGDSHERWIIKNDPTVTKGTTLIDTYENAIKKGYVRGIHDLSGDFLTLSNLPNYNFTEKTVSRSVKNAIQDYVSDKDIQIVSSGRGNILSGFTAEKPELSIYESSNISMREGWKDLAMAGALGLATLQGDTRAGQQPTPNNQTQSVQSKESFIDYMKRVENAARVGYDSKKRLWFPHKSVEGGSDTIAYGHKIQQGEDYSKGITDQQATELLKKDIEKAKSIVYKELKNRKLTPKQEEMFIDFVFNMGTLRRFPKFTNAALKNDTDSMKRQFKRFAGDKELKGRNTSFLKRFLTEYFGFNYYF